MMRGQEAFSGVRVLGYVVMANHFHLVSEVPEPRACPRAKC
jgi:REP element-mobilizing transposase RayT